MDGLICANRDRHHELRDHVFDFLAVPILLYRGLLHQEVDHRTLLWPTDANLVRLLLQPDDSRRLNPTGV